MTRAATGIIILLAFLYVGMCALLYFSQRSMIYYPQPRSLGAAQSATTLRTPDANLVVTAHAPERPDAILYFGGNAEDVSLSLPDLNAAFPDKALYLLHYRGYGGSSGTPNEPALHRDALALYEMARRKHSRITVIGRSLGSGVAIRLAASRPLERLVLVTPYYSLQELAARQFPHFPVRWLMRDKYESWRHAPHIHVPTTLIVAERDEIIPKESAKDLHATFPAGVAEYVLIAGADHNSISSSPDYLRALKGKEEAAPRWEDARNGGA